jgi:hypothetical protein
MNGVISIDLSLPVDPGCHAARRAVAGPAQAESWRATTVGNTRWQLLL